MVNLLGTVEITVPNDLDVTFFTPYGEGFKHIPASYFANAKKEMQGIAEFLQIRYDMPASLFLPYVYALYGKMFVSSIHELDLDMKVVQAPYEHLTVLPVQDAYVRQARPVLNYGAVEALAVGQGNDGQYKTYIDFDLTSIILNQNMRVKSIELYFDKIDSLDGNYTIKEITNTWREYTVLWGTTVNTGATIATGRAEGDNVFIDLTDYIKQQIALGKTYIRLAVTSPDFIIFGSRESGTPPSLIMTYQDPTWSGDFDDFILAGKAFVRGLRSNNMPSLYRLAKKFEMSARFIIRDPNIMQGTVIKSQPFMPGYFKIVHSSYLPGQLIVSKQSVTDIISRLHVPHTQLIGSVDMHRKADLLGKVIRKVPPEALDLEARINISRPHLLGLVSIVRSSYMQGKLNVAVAGRNDIQGKLGIIRSLLYGRYDSRPTSELIGSVAMQRQTDTNLIGNYTRIRSSLEGNVTVTIGADLQGKVYMKGFVHNVLQGSVLITKSSLLGKVEIVGTALSQFTGMFYVPYTSIMTGQVRVQRSEVEDITGSARIYIKAVNNMSGRLMIQLHSSLMGTMDVMQNSNLAGAVIKRVFDANDLNSLYFVTGALTRNYFRGRLNVKRTSSYLKGRYTVNTPARVVDTYRLGRLPRPWKRSDFL